MARTRSPFGRTLELLGSCNYSDGHQSFRDETVLLQHTHVEAVQAGDRPLPLIRLYDDDDDAAGGGFQCTHAIGEGGMGKVYAAHQPVLCREVAIKRVRPEKASSNATDALIQEAHLLARLEHPNIPPVHALGRDANGQPLLVMKRVRGVTWSDVASTPEHSWWDRISADHLTWHLRVLTQVCNVLAYAHSRHVLHRDIKLDNIMIGSFGESYVLDWGAAVALDENGEYSTKVFSGTPANAAPEMVRCDTPLDATTDVYLLGSLLHELLVGRARHASRTLRGMLRSAAYSKPIQYPADVPKQLADLCNRATHRDQRQRPATAALFREELESFLELRVASDLLEQAEHLLEQLRELRDNIVAIPAGQHTQARDLLLEQFHALGIRCRFAFEQVANAAPQYEHRSGGLAKCLRLQMLQAADNQNYQAAWSLLTELSEVHEISEELSVNLASYIREKERTHHERRDELSTQVQHALLDRLQSAEETVLALQSKLAEAPDEVTQRMKASDEKESSIP